MEQIKIEKNISSDKAKSLGVDSWPIWEKEKSEFPWSYQQQETCYIIEGKAEVVSADGSMVEFGKGDLVVFPRGLECIWKVKEPIKKNYQFS